MREPSTLVAPATAVGKAAVAMIRLSGPEAQAAATALCGTLPPPRVLALRRLEDETTGELLDRALVVHFPAPGSYTGEPVVELHLHGGRAVVARTLEVLWRQPGCGPAPAGAFTRRAFRHGRLDLTQAEGLAELIDAETAAQARQALREADGALATAAETWRGAILHLRAGIEASLDFADEGDVTATPWQAASAALAQTIRSELADRRGALTAAGIRVAVLGRPNVGKSSLVNALARRDVAIVTPIPGTTRDVVEVRLDLAGVAVILFDTAGVRETDDPVERLGVQRARRTAAEADLRLELLDDPDAEPNLAGSDDLLVLAKADLRNADELARARQRGWSWVSVVTADGLEPLVARLTEAVTGLAGSGGEALWSTERQRALLDACATALTAAAGQPDPVLAAEHLRNAAEALARLTGRSAMEDVLDAVFARFCIGK